MSLRSWFQLLSRPQNYSNKPILSSCGRVLCVDWLVLVFLIFMVWFVFKSFLFQLHSDTLAHFLLVCLIVGKGTCEPSFSDGPTFPPFVFFPFTTLHYTRVYTLPFLLPVSPLEAIPFKECLIHVDLVIPSL